MAFSSNDFYTSKRYFESNPTWDTESTAWKANNIDFILKKNQIKPKTIVEIGCGAGGILKELAELNPAIGSLTGFDISPQAIALAKEKESGKIKFCNTDFFSRDLEGTEVLLIIDVIEHIDDFYGFLNKINSRSEFFVFHVPLDLSCRNILKPHTIAVQRANVGHIHYFTKAIFELALRDTGFEVVDIFYTKPTPDRLPVKGFKKNVKKFLRNLSFRINKNLSAKLWGDYSIMVLAK